MKCPACGRRMRVPATVKKILDHLRVRTSPLPRATARAPTWEQQAFDDEAAQVHAAIVITKSERWAPRSGEGVSSSRARRAREAPSRASPPADARGKAGGSA